MPLTESKLMPVPGLLSVLKRTSRRVLFDGGKRPGRLMVNRTRPAGSLKMVPQHILPAGLLLMNSSTHEPRIGFGAVLLLPPTDLVSPRSFTFVLISSICSLVSRPPR